MLPTVQDCLLYCISRTTHRNRLMTHALAVREMTNLVEDIWTKADCCHINKKHITASFERNMPFHEQFAAVYI